MKVFYHILILISFFFWAEIVHAHEGWGIVLDRHGNIYFADIPQNKIWKLSKEGRLQVAVPGQHSHALVHGADGTIYGSHENGRIWKLLHDGQYSEVVPPSTSSQLSLHPLIIDAGGNIYSMNANRVQSGQVLLVKQSPNSRVDTIAGGVQGLKDGNGREAQFISIDGMAWGPDSLLYITDGPYVRTVTRVGLVTTITGNLTDEKLDQDLMGLIVDEPGNILVADYSGRRVLKISREGDVQEIIKSGGIWSPTGITQSGSELYVLEHLYGWLVLLGDIGIGPYIRIRKVFPAGQVTTLTTVWGGNTAIIFIILIVLAFLLFIIISRKKKRSHPALST